MSSSHRLQPVDLKDWVKRSNAAGWPKPILNFEEFWDEDFLIRVYDGPTPARRLDYHVNSAAEFFLQLQGDLTCTIVKNGEFLTEVCREGDMYWVPPNVPHLNQREEGSIGLVIHTRRKPGAKDAMVWYCPQCQSQVHRMDYLYEPNLRKLLGKQVKEFCESEVLRTCPQCAAVMPSDLGFS